MLTRNQRVLAIAARSCRLGYVLLADGVPASWGTSEKGAKSIDTALERLHAWVCEFRPAILVTEDPECSRHKGRKQRAIMQAFLSAAQELPVDHVTSQRHQGFSNLYDDAANASQGFPELVLNAPEKPPIWKSEPYRLVYYEALVLARNAGFVDNKTQKMT